MMENLKETLFKAYYENGGKTINIKSIDMLRDGGTLVIDFNYFGEPDEHRIRVDKDNGDFSLDGVKLQTINDAPLIFHIRERLQKFKESLQCKINYIDKIIE